MKKTFVALASAAALALGVAAAPTSASAYPAWVIPVIVATGVGGLAVGAAATASARPVVSDTRAFYDEPTVAAPRDCYPARARVNGVWRRVQICQ